jgi:hypothetical protein
VIARFNLDTGRDILAPHFARVQIDRQANGLSITDSDALSAFCLSMTRADITPERHRAFAAYVAQQLQARGGTMSIEKDAGLCIAVKG